GSCRTRIPLHGMRRRRPLHGMRRITAFALLSALFVSALPLSVSAEPDRPAVPPTESFEDLEGCIVEYAPKLYDYYKKYEPSGKTEAPSFKGDQRNYAWVSKIALEQVRSLDETGEWADLPSHDAANK